MSLATWHYVTAGLLVFLCVWQLASFAAGAVISRRAQGVNLVTMLLLALWVLLR